MIDIAKALLALRPGAVWTLDGGTYEGITWLDQTQTIPTKEEIETWVDPNAYKHQRAAEYPPVTDYIDGVVKGDQAQIDAYIAACLAVKAKYPKPEQ
jgi:hypothetical protein